MRLLRQCAYSLAMILTMGLAGAHAGDKPLKVYILAGQSNMQGQARNETLAGLAMDPATKTLYDKLVDKDGKPRVHDHVSIAAFSGSGGNKGKPVVHTEKHGKLTAGYGGDTTDGERLGPELGFGVTMYDHVHEPILIIKTSWGGKSLMVDFRPPSAGKLPDTEEERVGRYYRFMMEHVKKVLADPGKYCPDYDAKRGYEVAGFVWFQGFNDLVGDYPLVDPNGGRKGVKDYSEYSRLLSCLIRDVRKDLSAPKLPFAIGVLGVGGKTANENTEQFRKAMAAPAAMEEFKGTVKAVNTADYWDEKLGELVSRAAATGAKGGKSDKEGKYAELRKKLAPLQEEYEAAKGKAKREELKQKIINITYTPAEQDYLAKNKSNQAYHYLGSAKIYSQIGRALAEALVALEKDNRK